MPGRTQKKNAVGVSSADDPLVEADTEVVRTFASLSLRRLLIASLALLLVFVILASVGFGVGAHLFVTRGTDGLATAACPDSPLYINLVLNTKAIPACDATLRPGSALPCLRSWKLLTGGSGKMAKNSSDPLGPMACRDDAFSESKGCDNCRRNPFELTENGTAVVIPETGVYRVHSTVTFADSVDQYVSTIIRVVPAECAADPVCQASRAHGWLSCFNHNRPIPRRTTGSSKPAPSPAPVQFSDCAIDGVRRFNRGDTLSLHVTQRFRSIDSFYGVTYLVIHKL